MAKTALAAKAPEERRERILRATIAVVRERGFAGTRVTDIAAAAGTSQGLILYHFGSLAGAFAASLTLLEDEFYEELDRNLSEVVGPVPRLRHIAELGAGYGPAVGGVLGYPVAGCFAPSSGRRIGRRGICGKGSESLGP